MRALLGRTVFIGFCAAAAGCATAQSVSRPEAFPRSRPVNSGTPQTLSDSRPASNEASVSVPAPITPLPPATSSAAILQTAFDLLGTKYRFGGETPESGFDCSGFVSYVLRQHSIDVPRTVAEQYLAGQSVAQDEIKAGDLVFFTTTGPGATHVGIVVSTGAKWEFIHAPADGSVVRIERFDTGYWQQRWLGAKRVF